MRRPPQPVARPFGVRAFLVLVLAVLAGVVAMHGLGPAAGAAPSASHAPASQEHDSTAGPCGHPYLGDGDTGGAGGHVVHADATCSAAGTSSAPAPPPLLPSTATVEPAPTPSAPGRTDETGERAPPSLSELQLLRI